MKNRKPREKLGGPCARDAIFQPDKHPDWSLSLLISACFPVAKSRLSCAFAKPLRREVAEGCDAKREKKEMEERRGEKKKRERYSNQLASDDYLSRGSVRRFFMRCSVYALIQLDERKKIVQTALQRRQPLLYPSPPRFSTLPFVLRPFPTPLTHAVQRSRESV